MIDGSGKDGVEVVEMLVKVVEMWWKKIRYFLTYSSSFHLFFSLFLFSFSHSFFLLLFFFVFQ